MPIKFWPWSRESGKYHRLRGLNADAMIAICLLAPQKVWRQVGVVWQNPRLNGL
jgi:hypothetical protein